MKMGYRKMSLTTIKSRRTLQNKYKCFIDAAQRWIHTTYIKRRTICIEELTNKWEMNRSCSFYQHHRQITNRTPSNVLGWELIKNCKRYAAKVVHFLRSYTASMLKSHQKSNHFIFTTKTLTGRTFITNPITVNFIGTVSIEGAGEKCNQQAGPLIQQIKTWINRDGS